MGISISDKDIEWITARYPGLSIDRENGTIIGDLSFTRSHEGKVISDTYTLKILLEPLKGSMLPQVYELSSKITDAASKYGKELIDMHINTDKNNSFCLGIYDDEKKLFNFAFTIQEFFENSLESYLYWQSYFAKYGVPPWSEYAHGALGYIEYFAENDMSLNQLETIVSKKVLSQCLYHFDNIQDKCLCVVANKVCIVVILYYIRELKKSSIN